MKGWGIKCKKTLDRNEDKSVSYFVDIDRQLTRIIHICEGAGP